MTIYGYDSAQPPTLAQARDAKKAGIDVWAGYIGGPNAATTPWPASAWADVKKAGITPLPIYCANPGEPVQAQVDAAIAEAKRNGLGTTIALDIEANYASQYGSGTVDAFINAWNAALKKAGYTSVVYAGTHYSGSAPNWDPSWNDSASAPARGGHQYVGSVNRFGVNVDLDAFGATFPLATVLGGGHDGGAGLSGPGDGDTKVVVSKKEMTNLLDVLDSTHKEMVGIYTDLDNVLKGFPADKATAGNAAAHYEEASKILHELNGPADVGLRHQRGEIYQLQLLVQRIKKRAEKAGS